MDMGLKGKIAIVCASSRTGKGCTMALAAEGTDLIINGRDKETLNTTANEIKDKFNVTVEKFCADITKPESQNLLFELCPKPDILVNNTGATSR